MAKHKKFKRDNPVHEIKQEIDVSSNNHVTHNISFNDQPIDDSYLDNKKLTKQNEQAIQDFLWEQLQQEVDKCTDDEMLNKVLSKYGLRYEKGDGK